MEGKSLINIMNKRGPKWEPCGTPELTGNVLSSSLFSRIQEHAGHPSFKLLKLSVIGSSIQAALDVIFNPDKHLYEQVVEKSHEYNKDTYLLFVDFKAAYDSINRDQLWEVMESLGIPTKLTRLIKSCTFNSKSKISFGGELSEEFQVTTDLRQGDALSPALFNIALESVMRTVISQAKGIEIKDNQHLTAVAYADDIVLLAETVDDLKNTTDILLKVGNKIGLKINETKTKYMIISRQNHRSDSLKINEYTFERVGHFKYLGADINDDANSHEEVKRRLITANRCYYGLLPLFKSKLLSRKSKVTLYKVLVRPIALYASSTWATTKSDEKKLEVFERKILRKIFGPKKNNE
ncbi:hypothetical protein QTP88_027175 [Uroleucon formosanum]